MQNYDKDSKVMNVVVDTIMSTGLKKRTKNAFMVQCHLQVTNIPLPVNPR